MTPEKAATVTFDSTTLTDNGLPITTISKADLVNWLNSVQGTHISFFFGSEGDMSTDMYLMLGEKIAGGISSSNLLQSNKLPCPKYCKG